MQYKVGRRMRASEVWACAGLAAILGATLASTPARGGLHGVERIADELVYEVEAEAPLTLLLSKHCYPAEDGHLDAILWVGGDQRKESPAGALETTLRDAEGRVLARDTIAPILGPRMFFSHVLPEELAGDEGALEVVWREGGRERGRAAGAFRVEPAVEAAHSGRIRLWIPNETGARLPGLPVTAGVPFPRGALRDTAHLRLVDEAGAEVPLQVEETARWSRFGSVRWVRLDFTTDVDGAGLEFFLEYGPDVARVQSPGLVVAERPGRTPLVEAGRLRFGDGIAFDPGDGGGFRTVVTAEGLDGAFVEHEDGTRYVPPAEAEWEIEESGPRKAVLRRRGWYEEEETGRRFCRFDTRFVLHHGSPLVRVFHTWIYTGDAYEDRICNMGWRFGLDTPGDAEFLAGFGSGAWGGGDYLLQHDFEAFEVIREGRWSWGGERAPGVARVAVPGARMLVGVKDFWQTYPNELEFAEGAIWVHSWPRHGRPALHPVRIEDGLRLWFAHEGELLDFALPLGWTEDPDFYYASPSRNRRPYQMRHRRATVNAQGVARTEELWLLFEPAEAPDAEGAAVMEGLHEGTLRASVDPAWIAASGAFYEIHHRDVEHYPEEERAFELAALAPMQWVERMRFYGKWIWGDMTWEPDLDNRGFGLYRGFRKAHQGWPYSWIPYARSGDPRLLRFADAATRHIADVVFVDYADERVPGRIDDGRPRPRGFTIRFRVPWATHTVNPSTRGYVDKVDYLLHSYYLTGYPRARDVFLDWRDLTKYEGWNNWGGGFDDRTNFRAEMTGDAQRGSVNLLKAYTETYEATFDPWFLAAAHQIARGHRQAFERDGWTGYFWQSGPREFLRFSGCPDYRAFYLAYARTWTAPEADFTHYVRTYPMMEPAAFGWVVSGDPYFLRRSRAMLDEVMDWTYTYDGQPEHHRGRRVTGGFTHYMGNLLQYFPNALHAVAQSGDAVPPLPMGFYQLPATAKPVDAAGKSAYRYLSRMAFRKTEGEPLPLRLRFQRPGLSGFRYRVEGPSGETAAQGVIRTAESGDVIIAASAASGVYRLALEGESLQRPDQAGRIVDGPLLPVAPPHVPAVWLMDEGHRVGPASWNHGAQYWFLVPEGLDEFRMEFAGPAPKITVRNPVGEPVWTFEAPARTQAETPLRIDVPVPPEHSGRLWRVAIAGSSHGLRFDPRIPPYLSVDPDRWFDPEEKPTPTHSPP